MTESRFQRWSRKKAEAREEVALADEETQLPEPTEEESELAINESLSEPELLEKYDLPNPDDIQLGTDITGFMRNEIPEFLRRRALRALWKSNPVLAVLDGLNDYDDDYTGGGVTMGSLKTMYKVGEGFLDRSKRDEPDVDAEESLDEAAPVVGSESADNASNEIQVDAEESAEPARMSTQDVIEEKPAVETPELSQPTYRPRMRFES